MIQNLDKLDKDLFLFLNSLNSPILDGFMVFISSYLFWMIAFIGLGIILYYYHRNIKELFFYGGSTLLAVGVANLIKIIIQRPRPIHHEEWVGIIHSIDKYSHAYSFFSSHAASVFCFAFFVFLSLKTHRIIGIISLILAFLISYSRIYLGKHFPGDVLVGSLVGILIAWIGVSLYHKYSPNWNIESKSRK